MLPQPGAASIIHMEAIPARLFSNRLQRPGKLTAVEVVLGKRIQRRSERQVWVFSQFEGVDPARLTTAGDTNRLVIVQTCGYGLAMIRI